MRLAAGLICVILMGCASHASGPPTVTPKDVAPAPLPDAPWRSRIEIKAGSTNDSPDVVIADAKLLLGDGTVIERGYLVLAGGRIEAVGKGDAPSRAGAERIDAKGKVVTPGLIDAHSHLGVYPTPHAAAHRDGNEATAPVTAGVRAVDAFWPQDPGIERALAGGITTLQALPGSANLVGGRALTLKLRRATSPRQMRIAGAPDGLKMACGENPKRVYGGRDMTPSTRMGNLAMQRTAFLQARRLIDEWDLWRKTEGERRTKQAEAQAEYEAEKQERELRLKWCEHTRSPSWQRQCEDWKREWANAPLEEPDDEPPSLPPPRNLDLETLAAALEGRILVHVHCYRADDISAMLALADEVGFQIRSFHHGLEAYKVRRELARRKIAVSTWADWWGFKLEAYDGIPQNVALLEAAGGIPIVHSDSAEGIQRLNQEAAKALYSGLHAGMKLDPSRAIRWITMNPAWALGIGERTGTLAKGKDADVVVWSGDPLSVYTKAERVYVDGQLRYDSQKSVPPESDFEVEP